MGAYRHFFQNGDDMWKVDEKKCLTCGGCVGVCPVSALELTSNYGLRCDIKKCISCKACQNFCPVGAIEVEKDEKSE